MNHYHNDNSKFGLENWFHAENLFRKMVQKYPSGSNFVELGVWKGRSTSFLGVEILNSGKNIKLHCIDRWDHSEFLESVMVNGVIDTTKMINNLGLDIKVISPAAFKMMFDISAEDCPNEKMYQQFLMNIEPIKDYINVVRKDSADAANDYEDSSIDFIYIDADHTYEGVMRDIQAWFPKMKKGSVMAGDDYYAYAGPNAPFKGLIRAVDDFFGDKVKEDQTSGVWYVEIC